MPGDCHGRGRHDSGCWGGQAAAEASPTPRLERLSALPGGRLAQWNSPRTPQAKSPGSRPAPGPSSVISRSPAAQGQGAEQSWWREDESPTWKGQGWDPTRPGSSRWPWAGGGEGRALRGPPLWALTHPGSPSPGCANSSGCELAGWTRQLPSRTNHSVQQGSGAPSGLILVRKDFVAPSQSREAALSEYSRAHPRGSPAGGRLHLHSPCGQWHLGVVTVVTGNSWSVPASGRHHLCRRE